MQRGMELVEEQHERGVVVVEATYSDPDTGALYVHKDLVQARKDWETEEHIGPVTASPAFGDVESWTKYVKTYGRSTNDDEGSTLLTWNSKGLLAILDYHSAITPNYASWTAAQPFTLSPEWRAWESFANGQPISQRVAIERLEDLGEDITDPPETALTQMLRDLRAMATARADTELRPDGTSAITWTQDKTVSNKAGTLELPPIITVAIPVLTGDVARYAVKVRMRVSVGDDAKLAFRFSLVNAERILEAVYAERVKQARELLGDDYTLLRAAG